MPNGEATNTNFIVFGLARPGQLRLKFPCIDHSIAEQTRNLLIRKELHKPLIFQCSELLILFLYSHKISLAIDDIGI